MHQFCCDTVRFLPWFVHVVSMQLLSLLAVAYAQNTTSSTAATSTTTPGMQLLQRVDASAAINSNTFAV